jgi:hypothetical protein
MNIPEQDWKYLNSIKKDLLELLSKRINDEAIGIIRDSFFSQHERYLNLYNHVMKMNGIIANCFDGWSRSTLLYKILVMIEHQLIIEEHISKLSSETQSIVNNLLVRSEDWSYDKVVNNGIET